MTRTAEDLASALRCLTTDQEAIASSVRRAQANFLAAWEKHRQAGDDATQRDLEQAKAELADVQRHVVEVTGVPARR